MPKSAPLTTIQIWYRRLIKLYPREFKARFGPEVVQLFDDIHRDLQHAPPHQRTGRLLAACLDTLASISEEQATTLYELLTKDISMSKKSSSSSLQRFTTRHPKAAVTGSSLAILLLAAVWAGPPLIARASAIYTHEQTIHQTLRHNDQGRVTSLFVNDYILAKEGLATKRPIGYDSPLAMNTPARSLKKQVKDAYGSLQSGFDPLICSSALPAMATFDTDLTGPSMGLATVTARFTYPGSPVENTVTYTLAMQSGANEGWRITGVSCTSLNHSANPPYTLSVRPDSEQSIEAPY